ncbi:MULTISPECIES: GGDEF domain-containing protein [unclassified Pseudomonas]|uniref:GGDEF domain-containing protein n=1 Tax=unclassified Pseudomonas TaxID=196821 RepID=UPI000C86B2CD|nr:MULTISPECIES: diguanylate cyclase [unclassified Pseudomonas]PMV22684.1 GGDEF domain-containing protein [Pseudomonas sp. FW305-3-2-15-C-TSA2]PMV29347.1 GGDEF domain-containing protein [Pseudomonas sp. DP16D-L5]PMV39250.1 GGDEF domain-containing protein [Pseudomonas sp. FW305-3-2-15-A-LB2]PMV45560.1 GGDEF domain-containing protein [Pseudomonas sp. FW305-3-2-15-C-R2A1]PMV51997.1 GGDEF domain-containing protein [Pseudomonas sp. FW305-3-2-15-C-LB1]
MKTLSPSDHAQLFRETTAQFWRHIVPIVQLGFFIHCVFIFIFSMLHLPLLALSNVLSVLIYAGCLKAIRAGRYSLTGLLMSVEIILHALLATWVLGWDSNFYFYLYCLIPIIAFSFQDALLPRLVLYLAILAVSVGGFALRRYLGINSGVALYWLELFGIVNVLAALGVLLHCTALSVRFTRSMQAKLFQTANRDSLTNLYTRRRVMHEVLQLAASGSSTIILLDIDHFKQINDRLGHERGDWILQRVAQAINSNVRATDVASRWGGEEFLVLMPSTPVQASKAVAERILLRIREWVGQLDDAPLTVTATLAVSGIRPGESFESALNRADQALYQGKHQGRNQVVLAD